MDTITNIFLWTSRFTTILSQCRGSPWYQVWSKIAGIDFSDLVLILPEAASGGVL